MTYYIGGKKKIGEEISNIIKNVCDILEKENKIEIKGYCEPFCGMMGVYQHIPGIFEKHKPKLKFKAGDRNHYIIKLWKGLQNGYRPPTTCSKSEYTQLKKSNNKTLKGIFLGFAGAIRGVFRSTFMERNIATQSEQCIKIGKLIKNVQLSDGEYHQYSNLKNYIIYCDPPYRDRVTPYAIGEKYDTRFDYDKFTEWCKSMSKDNIIFVSEYKKPSKDFVEIWSDGKEKLYLLMNKN